MVKSDYIFLCLKFISNGHMESLIKNSSPVGVKFGPEFLMSISCFILNMNKNSAQFTNY